MTNGTKIELCKIGDMVVVTKFQWFSSEYRPIDEIREFDGQRVLSYVIDALSQGCRVMIEECKMAEGKEIFEKYGGGDNK